MRLQSCALGVALALLLCGMAMAGDSKVTEFTEATRRARLEATTPGLPVAALDDQVLYRTPEVPDDRLPLAQVAAGIVTGFVNAVMLEAERDPALSARKDWPVRAAAALAQHTDYWMRLNRASMRYVDLDNCGSEEFVVVSDGLHYPAPGDDCGADESGCRDFCCVLKQKRDNRGGVTKDWELWHFEVLPRNLGYNHEDAAAGSAVELGIAVCDLDRDLRPDVLLQLPQHGGSGSTYYLRVLSVSRDMKLRAHQLLSAFPFRIAEHEAVRPVMVTYGWDAWGDNDCGASVSGRGPRRMFWRWTVENGFVSY